MVTGVAAGLTFVLLFVAGVVRLVRGPEPGSTVGAPAAGATPAMPRGPVNVAAVVGVVGIAVGVLIALSPVHVHELGTDINCGLGPIAALDNADPGDDRDVVEMCQHEGGQRLIYGGAVAGVAAVAAAALRRRG